VTATISQRPTFAPQTGEIAVHAREGLYLPLTFESVAADGTVTPRNATGLPLFFEVAGKFRVPLEPGATSNERVIVLTRAQAATLFGGNYPYALIDESGTIPDTPLSGFISTYGYKDQPA
jgi:hypothetical protein